MIQAKVDVGAKFGDELRRRANMVAKEAVEVASKAGAAKAADGAAARKRTGKMAEMEVLEVEGTGTGWTGGFRSQAWYARFQSTGTKGGGHGAKGIQGLKFLEAGRTEGKRVLIDELERRLGAH